MSLPLILVHQLHPWPWGTTMAFLSLSRGGEGHPLPGLMVPPGAFNPYPEEKGNDSPKLGWMRKSWNSVAREMQQEPGLNS